MAARHLQRISSGFLRNQAINPKPMPYFQSTRILDQFCVDMRAFQTKSEPADIKKVAIGVEEEQNNSTSLKYSVASSLKTSRRHDLAMIFTCKVCETRSVKTASRESYDKGVVVARCDGCDNLHLIADRLGLFGEPGSIEELLAARGEQVKKVLTGRSANTLIFLFYLQIFLQAVLGKDLYNVYPPIVVASNANPPLLSSENQKLVIVDRPIRPMTPYRLQNQPCFGAEAMGCQAFLCQVIAIEACKYSSFDLSNSAVTPSAVNIRTYRKLH